ncbi:MAG TPA: hypothetical protein ENJ51_04525 [Leucothrix mucor]|uniref:Uncharacterized protein n=1 Tax=Leucothrix mucor TaxID=45248 RepID=A0A7V2WUR9_LEUMU|nr:hypothetical protein [Leucothrix mucor]
MIIKNEKGIDVHTTEFNNPNKRNIAFRETTCKVCAKAIATFGTGRALKFCSNSCKMKDYRLRVKAKKTLRN